MITFNYNSSCSGERPNSWLTEISGSGEELGYTGHYRQHKCVGKCISPIPRIRQCLKRDTGNDDKILQVSWPHGPVAKGDARCPSPLHTLHCVQVIGQGGKGSIFSPSTHVLVTVSPDKVEAMLETGATLRYQYYRYLNFRYRLLVYLITLSRGCSLILKRDEFHIHSPHCSSSTFCM